MASETVNPRYFDRKADQVMAYVPAVLAKWGLMPKFMRWRLTQDPSTGMVVLFGVLNNKHIAAYTQTPFSAYFDPRLLHELATDLQVQVIPSDLAGLRYAFVLDWGQLGMFELSLAGLAEAPAVTAAISAGIARRERPDEQLSGDPQSLNQPDSAAGIIDRLWPREMDDDLRPFLDGSRAGTSEVASKVARVGRKWGVALPGREQTQLAGEQIAACDAVETLPGYSDS